MKNFQKKQNFNIIMNPFKGIFFSIKSVSGAGFILQNLLKVFLLGHFCVFQIFEQISFDLYLFFKPQKVMQIFGSN